VTTRAIPGRIAAFGRIRRRPLMLRHPPSLLRPPAWPPLIFVLAGLLAAASGLNAQASSGVLTGFITDGAGSPTPRITVVATGDGGGVEETHTDDEGRFRLTLVPGPYRLEIATRSGASRKTATVVVLAGETVRIDIVVPPGDATMGPVTARRQAPGVAFILAPPPLAMLPLDRADAPAAILALAPGVARGSAFGAAADVGTPRRLDGLDLSDPLDGSAWTSFVLPAATSAAVRAGPSVMAATLREVRSICLWRSLISRYFTWKLRHDAPRIQRASGRPSACTRLRTSLYARLSSAGRAQMPISA